MCTDGGTGFATCSVKESAADSDADLDVDGDDTLEYGKAQYTEADIIPCSGAGEDQGEAREREALRGAVLNGGMPSNRITPECSKWASDEMPSTSNGESSKTDPGTPSSSCSSSCAPRTCKNSEIEKVTEEDSTATTMDALKARIRELERQILRGDRYKCLICMRKPAIQSGAEIKSLGVWPGPRPLANGVGERQPKSLPLGLYCLYRGLVIGGYGSGIKRLLPQPLRRWCCGCWLCRPMVSGLVLSDSYTMPLTSIQCWHVHCEECWLRTLSAVSFERNELTGRRRWRTVVETTHSQCAAYYHLLLYCRWHAIKALQRKRRRGNKKLCPQCNTITSPGDLRRVY
ncbi:hypothetical protein JOQ06_001979, partial [Pogonophryne albipinna]